MDHQKELSEQLDALPSKPGVYLMKGQRAGQPGRILYVGKAVNLRSRVRSYFHASTTHSPKVQQLVRRIRDIDFIVTDSELEALILECNLIKRHRPRYNVRLKDDKRYPYIKVNWQDDFPKVEVTRRMKKDGARYFGPYTAVWAVNETLNTLRKIFPYLTCNRNITGDDERACLYWHIGLCMGPCIGAVSAEEYRAMIKRLCRFLEGKTAEVVEELEAQMSEAAENLEYEKAAQIRDQLEAIERVVERQKVVSAGSMADQDVIALARDEGDACVQVFFIRRGKLIGREYFILEGTEGEDPKEVMTSFVKQFYDEAAHVPSEVILQNEVDEARIIESWLRDKRGTKVGIKVPRRGKKRDLVEMAAENAAETLNTLRAQWQADTNRSTQALTELQEHLELQGPPTRIECYDISNTQGTGATGSMVVFAKGVPRKSDYRRFRIRSVDGNNDYAMLQEVLERRFRRAEKSQEKPGGHAWGIMPDLIIVDGGRGQLNAALEVIQDFGLDHLPVIGLAKKEEEIFRPGQPEPLRLPRESTGLYLLQRIRDEAHRFAVNYHRKLRRKTSLTSTLEDVRGIGPKRRKALLQHFGSLDAIRKAASEDLAKVPGMTRKAAEAVKDYF